MSACDYSSSYQVRIRRIRMKVGTRVVEPGKQTSVQRDFLALTRPYAPLHLSSKKLPFHLRETEVLQAFDINTPTTQITQKWALPLGFYQASVSRSCTAPTIAYEGDAACLPLLPETEFLSPS